MISHSTYKDATPNAWRDDIRNVIDEVGWIRVDVQNEAYNAQYDRQYACRQLQRAQYLSRVGSVRLVNCRLRGICRLTDYDGLRLLLSYWMEQGSSRAAVEGRRRSLGEGRLALVTCRIDVAWPYHVGVARVSNVLRIQKEI